MSCRLTAQSNLHNWSSSLIAATSRCLAHLNVKKKRQTKENEKWNCSIAIQIISERGSEASHDNLISDWHRRDIFIRLRRRHRVFLLKGELHASKSYEEVVDEESDFVWNEIRNCVKTSSSRVHWRDIDKSSWNRANPLQPVTYQIQIGNFESQYFSSNNIFSPVSFSKSSLHPHSTHTQWQERKLHSGWKSDFFFKYIQL